MLKFGKKGSSDLRSGLKFQIFDTQKHSLSFHPDKTHHEQQFANRKNAEKYFLLKFMLIKLIHKQTIALKHH